jgi:hypothetical protein
MEFAMPTKYTMLFTAKTLPTDGTNIAPRVGGWSESHWRTAADQTVNQQMPLITRRLALLPNTQLFIGVRVVVYNIVQGRLIQTGLTPYPLNLLGGNILACDVPSMALQINANATPPDVNNCTFDFRGVPDARVVGGEFSTSRDYSNLIAGYLGELGDNSWGWIGVDKAQPKVRVMSLSNVGVLTVGPGSGVAVGDFIQLFRVKFDGGKSANGKYLVSAVAGNEITVFGTGTNTISAPNGLARRLVLKFLDYGTMFVKGVRNHKVGGPFGKYRGRRSAR